ncbi:SAC3/GANP/Nin1/mts3/eIF-3 p25 family-domain-containing protein [Boeremia exigua]|uniref:SAC3/GANP/Nin1/mts3/eIF-3 p25 family-domain-containing protein n=1 Tax=Boeremia exigua TaxID=749465 RepID=UPI001E8DAED7|nr:SAC3/GANP/Nin1/mts3/eIF-3 p25 family-domain-containing protein [Boeremia exigua]KAH6622097.1 SAC3/GANP/Nin1/mts3/eIF-3 p25 family-domain-containing protein [Boeremia exigua]
MSTVARGGGSRGGRGRGAGVSVWRGSSTRGGLNGASSDSSDKPALGAKKRGGGAQTGGSKTRSHAQELDEDGNPKASAPFVSMNKYGTAANSTPHAIDDYTSRFTYLQNAQSSWRKQLQEKGFMNPDGQMKLSDSVKLVGRCNDMCPEFERVRRIVQNDFKRPECTPETEHLPYSARVPDESRMVKAFTRSSAGADVELVIDIRSPAACLKTVHYLFSRLDTEGFDHLHAWIWDRTRSVRKDLRTQVVEKPSDIRTLLVCLEASARFYLLSMHQMAQSEKEDYSHQQDMEQFNQTLTTLRERYDDNRRANIPSDNEAEFVAYRLILASFYANSQLENELHSLPNDLRNNRRVLTAIEIFKAAKSAFNFGSDKSWIQAHANWKKFWDLVKSPSVSYLMACAAEVTFNRVRHVILDSIWHAYRRGSKGDVSVEAWTTDKLKDVLAMDDDKDAVKLCELYGFHFGRSNQGHTFLDISKLGNSNKSLGVPHTIKPQMFSKRMVESKRHNRAFSAVIQGMTVQQARSNRLLVDPKTIQTGDEDSLFVPETVPVAKPNIFSQNSNTTNGMPNPGPFASPFQPPSQPSSGISKPNPFGNPFVSASSISQPTQTATAPIFGAPGISDATKHPSQFAPKPAPNTNDNPFAKAAAAFPPQSTTPSSTPPGSFIGGGQASTEPQGHLSSGQSTPAFGQTANPPTSDASKPFVFPGLPELDWKIRNGQILDTSSTPAGSPPPPDGAAQAAEKEKAEADARAAVLKQRQEIEARRKREQEEQERRAKEAQQAKEAELRQIEEEKQRQLREKQQRELQERQEQERRIREEQQRRQREEDERQARIRRRETAYGALTSSIMFSGEDGLLYQFLENTVRNVAREGYEAWQAQKRQEMEAAEREKKRQAFARAVFTHWVAQVQRKKRNAKARERRKRLKAQRELSINGEGDAASEIASAESVASTLVNGASTTKHAPANHSRRVKRTEQRRAGAIANHVTQATSSSQSRAASSQHAQKSDMGATMTNGHHVRSYSEAYKKSTAPIDRTETDWFKLRAMGIDPSKHRKRSFDSATDEEHKGDAETKRIRRSDPTVSLISQPPPEPEASKPLTIEERLARIRAVKQSFATSGSGSPPVNGATPKHSSFNGRSSLLMSHARELIAKSPTAQRSPVAVHDFGRSVPNLSVSTSSFRQSFLGKSAGSAQSNKPAYWGRASRFVPQHLYGKGAEAIRAYRDKYINSPTSTPQPAIPEPLALSSPIPAQFSYIPQPGYTQYSENGSGSGVDFVDIDAESNIAGDTEEDSFDGDDEEAEDDNEDFDEEDDADDVDVNAYPADYDEQEEYTTDDAEQFAQPGSSLAIGPGATQDDAIELSD